MREMLELAQRELGECFEVVMAMVRGANDAVTGEEILGLQPKLLRTVLQLEGLYRDTKKEQARLISRKGKYQQTWFKRRMAKLASYGKALRAALAIARAVGDGYAWFWYERDKKLIDEHLKHQHQPFLPPGAGGLGERLTLERMQGFDGKLLLYHGLTSFLRMGDVTFVDMHTARVAYLAEIKTTKVDDQSVTVELSLVMDANKPKPELPATEVEGPPPPSLPQRMRAKREQQVKAMGDAVVRAVKDADRQVGIDGLFHFSELDEVVAKAPKGDFAFAQAGPSMIIAAARSSARSSLADALLGTRKPFKPRAHGVEGWVRRIVLPESEHNALIMSSPGGPENLSLGSTDLPFMFWPAERETLRRILFQDVIVVTLHNPAHFWAALEQRGFEPKKDQRGRFTGARKVETNRVHELENFRHFERLTPDAFVKLETVLAMIDHSLQEMAKIDPAGRIRMEIKPRISRKRSKEEND